MRIKIYKWCILISFKHMKWLKIINRLNKKWVNPFVLDF